MDRDPRCFGETLDVPERIIVAPAVGVFRPAPDDAPRPHDALRPGDPVGVIDGPGIRVDVRSPFAGKLMGLLAQPGEQLQVGQPVAWLRTD